MANMMQTAHGKLPWPPTVNKYWMTMIRRERGTGKTKKTVTRSPEVMRYMDHVGYCLMEQRVRKITHPYLRLELMVYPPDRKKRDLDNICKAVLDALQHNGIYDDDFNVCQLYVERKEARQHGEIEFLVRAIEV